MGKMPLRVFIADDSMVVSARLITMLADIGNVEIAGHGRSVSEATNSILRIQPDVVILDIQMPGGSGIDVLMSIREQKSSAIVIVFTNYPFPQYRKKCEAAGANFFFDKSNEFEEMLAVVQKIAEGSAPLPAAELTAR